MKEIVLDLIALYASMKRTFSGSSLPVYVVTQNVCSRSPHPEQLRTRRIIRSIVNATTFLGCNRTYLYHTYMYMYLSAKCQNGVLHKLGILGLCEETTCMCMQYICQLEITKMHVHTSFPSPSVNSGNGSGKVKEVWHYLLLSGPLIKKGRSQ